MQYGFFYRGLYYGSATFNTLFFWQLAVFSLFDIATVYAVHHGYARKHLSFGQAVLVGQVSVPLFARRSSLLKTAYFQITTLTTSMATYPLDCVRRTLMVRVKAPVNRRKNLRGLQMDAGKKEKYRGTIDCAQVCYLFQSFKDIQCCLFTANSTHRRADWFL